MTEAAEKAGSAPEESSGDGCGWEAQEEGGGRREEAEEVLAEEEALPTPPLIPDTVPACSPSGLPFPFRASGDCPSSAGLGDNPEPWPPLLFLLRFLNTCTGWPARLFESIIG